MDRWILYTDIEGFGPIFNAQTVPSDIYGAARPGDEYAHLLLHGLVSDVFHLGEDFFNGIYERIFAHLMGDGFLIAFDIAVQDRDTVLGFAMALMRSMLARGGCLKTGVVKGRVADVSGLYPAEVMDAKDEDGRIRIGRGFMTLTTVIGPGLIDAHKLAGAFRGPFLILRDETDLGEDYRFQAVGTGPRIFTVDWIHSVSEVATEMLESLRRPTDSSTLEERLRAHLVREPRPKSEWVEAANEPIGGY